MKRLDFDTVHQHVTVADLIQPLREAFARSVTVPPRAHYRIGAEDAEATLLIMPSWRAEGSIGVKIVTVLPHNPKRGLPSIQGEFMLICGQTGKSLALVDGRALTLLRTAATSALAGDLLAPSEARVLLMVGTGALASYLIRGHLATRPYEAVLIWGRSAHKAAFLAHGFAEQGVPARAVSDIEKAARDADVISCATMADAPLIQGSWLKPQAHLDLVGGFRPSMREADDACFRNAFVVVDTLRALDEAGDLIAPLVSGALARERVDTLSRVIEAGRPHGLDSRTVFKSVGSALTDLAAAEWIFGRSQHFAGSADSSPVAFGRAPPRETL